MYEHLVKNVLETHKSYEAWHSLTAEAVEDGQKLQFIASEAQIGMIETWLAQTKTPTPWDRADRLVLRWDGYGTQRWRKEIAAEIVAAIEADRAERGDPT